MIIKHYLKIVVILILGHSAVGCNDDDYPTAPKIVIDEGSKRITLVEPSTTTKEEAYLEFFNWQATNLDQALERYFFEVGREKEVKLSTNSFKNLAVGFSPVDSIKERITKPPLLPIDKDMETLITFGMQIEVVLDSARDYYENREYLKDNYQKAQKIHDRILHLSDPFLDAYYSIGYYYVNEKRGKLAQLLQVSKDKGDMPLFYQLSLLENAENMMVTLVDFKDNNLDTELLKSYLAQFREHQSHLQALMDNEETFKKSLRQDTMRAESQRIQYQYFLETSETLQKELTTFLTDYNKKTLMHENDIKRRIDIIKAHLSNLFFYYKGTR